MNKNKGFTLLEILLVIAAIGILAAIVLVAINPNRQLAQVRNAERRSEINTIYKAIEQYLIETSSYPTGITTSLQDICNTGSNGVGQGTAGSNCVDLRVLVPDYIASIPIDPQGVAYKVSINGANNRVSVYASNAELGQVIGVNNAWTPAQLSGLSLWLDAADASTITLNGSTVSQWDDKSGTGNDVSNATAATQPDYLATGWNGQPTISFTRNGQEFLFKDSVTSFSAAGDFTIASAFEFLETGNSWDMIAGWRSTPNVSGGGNGSPILQGVATSQQIGYHNTDQTDTRIKVDVTTRLGKKLATISRSGGSNGNGGAATVTSTGYSQATYDTNATQSWTSQNPTGFQIGGRQQTATSYGDKYISEVIGYNTKLSTEDRQKVEGYLAWKWGLEANLPAGHPYKNAAP